MFGNAKIRRFGTDKILVAREGSRQLKQAAASVNPELKFR